MTEIYLDDYHLYSRTVANLPTKVDRGVTGLEAPEQRVDAYDNPGADGQTVANILHGGRFITMEGTIRGFGETDAERVAAYRANRAAFHQLVGANRVAGRFTPRVLKLVDATGTEYRLTVVVRSLKNPDELPASSRWQLQLQATDFLIYSETEQSTSLTLPVSGGVTLPLTFPFSFGASSGGSATATNNGTSSTAPTIVFAGPLQNPRLSNDTTGEVMELNLTLLAGEEVTVDMANRTIIQDTSTNRMSAKTSASRFWSLAPGENILRLTATTFDSGTATMTWRDAYVGL
jgi:hypothetical protein